MGKTATYVLGLIDAILGPGEREVCFTWALGDPSPKTKRARRLPFDGVWEARKLIIEIDEDQHTQATPFFDKPNKLTVSGVHRGKQRALYDSRKRAAAKQAGYQLVAIGWPRKKQQHPIKDAAELRQLLRDAGVLPQGETVAPTASGAGPWDPYVELYDVELLEPPHVPSDAERKRVITARMKEHGWRGRPLLAARHGLPGAEQILTCLTGSHRVDAAREAGIKRVPVLVIDCRDDLGSEPILDDPLQDVLRYAVNESAALVLAIRALWAEEDGYQ